MCEPHRLHYAILVVFAITALLLLYTLPPTPPRPPARPHPARLNITTSAPARENYSTSATTIPRSDIPQEPQQLYTKEVYVSGHSRPHPELCPALGEHVKLLILIASAPAHESSRQAIRLTWGHYTARSDIAIAFVLGVDDGYQPMIDKEDELYNDIIQGRFLDSYSNLTLKTLSMFEWVDTYCSVVPHILKTDDDMFINVPRLLSFSDAHRGTTNTIWGRIFAKRQPVRNTEDKYYMSPLQFEPKVYPDFTNGPAYLITQDCISRVLKAAPDEPYLRLEDVFVTGLLAMKLQIKLQHVQEFYNKSMKHDPCIVQDGISIHMVKYHEQFDLWSKLLDGKTVCENITYHRLK